MKNINTSPYRFIYERLSLFERPVFIKFFSKKAIRDIFKDVDKAEGDVYHVFEVLTLIWDEDGGDSQRRRYNQPYLWQKNVDRTVRRRGEKERASERYGNVPSLPTFQASEIEKDL